MPPISAELLDAYQRTTYWIALPDAYLGLKVDQAHPLLDNQLVQRGLNCWSVLTACNPQSRLLTPTENSHRMGELVETVEAEQWPTYSACGVGASGDWPPEPSLLVLGITAEQAVELARRFDQHAVLFGEVAQPARLIWIAPSSGAPA